MIDLNKVRNEMKRKATFGGFSGLVLVLAATGCQQEPTPAPPMPTASTSSTATPAKYVFKTKTGTPVAVGDASLISNQAQARAFGIRKDPFALLPVERGFDQSQLAERLTSEMGYSTMYEPPVETDSTEEVIEPQPYRRLAGILVGDTVSAILIMEDGQAHLIKPGMRIPNSPWRVVSIDEEKAVLRRAGNVKPTQIVIRLESPPGGVPNPGGAPGGGGPPGGVRPGGGPPGGFPGGPAGRPGTPGGAAGRGGEIG